MSYVEISFPGCNPQRAEVLEEGDGTMLVRPIRPGEPRVPGEQRELFVPDLASSYCHRCGTPHERVMLYDSSVYVVASVGYYCAPCRKALTAPDVPTGYSATRSHSGVDHSSGVE